MVRPLRVRYSTINRLVDDLLARAEVKGTCVPIEDIAKASGLEIAYTNLEPDLSGFLLRRPDQLVIGVNADHPRPRQRFTIAHELGHALLHDGEELHVDRSFRVNYRSALSSAAVDIEEIEANTFAASILMPARFLRRQLADYSFDIEDDVQISRLADNYGVSQQAMSFRLHNLWNRAVRQQS